MKYTIPVKDIPGHEWLVTKEYADMFRKQDINEGDSIDIITDTGEVVSVVVDEGTCDECVCYYENPPCIVYYPDPQQEAGTVCVFSDNEYIFKDRHKILEEL